MKTYLIAIFIVSCIVGFFLLNFLSLLNTVFISVFFLAICFLFLIKGQSEVGLEPINSLKSLIIATSIGLIGLGLLIGCMTNSFLK